MFTIIIICCTHDTGESHEDMTEASFRIKKCFKTLIKAVGHSNETFKAPANAQYLNSEIIQISSAQRELRMENCFSLNSLHAVNGKNNFFRIPSERKPDKPKIPRSCLLVMPEHSNFPRHFLWNIFAYKYVRLSILCTRSHLSDSVESTFRPKELFQTGF